MSLDNNIKLTESKSDISLDHNGESFVFSRLLRVFHTFYAISVASLTTLTLKINNTTLFWLTLIISISLIVDNVRYGSHFSDDIHKAFSRISYTAHEAITPFGLMYIVAVLWKFVVHEIKNYFFWLMLLLSIYWSYSGFIRYIKMSGWKLVPYYGLRIYKPSNLCHSALIPIFATVLGLIVAGFYSWRVTSEIKYFNLFISQLIVFFGNGFLSGRKVLFALFANLLEVLWLWSIIQSLL